MAGRISLLVSKDFQVLTQAARSLPAEVSKQLRAHTRRVAEPAFQEEMRSRVGTRIESRVLLDTARVSVRDDQVTLRSATIGKVHGTPANVLAGGAEFGGSPNREIRAHSRKGKTYTRRLGTVFRAPRRGGYVFHPATSASIRRVGALWYQTVYRTVAETFEKVSS